MVLVTTRQEAQRKELSLFAKQNKLGEINVPKQIITLEKLPLLGTGKINYQEINVIVAQ